MRNSTHKVLLLMYWKWMKKWLFSKDPETIHHYLLQFLHYIPPLKGDFFLRRMAQLPLSYESFRKKNAFSLWNLTFHGKVGLAAGFDKNAQILSALPHLGFSFAEIGTVTPLAQEGNPKPRLFRDVAQNALFNKMGFNNLGAYCVLENFLNAKKHLPSWFRTGLNIGKNKETSLKKAPSDYSFVLKVFRNTVDFVVINISSPNTPKLRELQKPIWIRPLLDAVETELQNWSPIPPLLLKLSPEIQGSDLNTLIETAEPLGVQGWVLTNTVSGLWNQTHPAIQGGWSGAPVRSFALKSLQEAKKITQKPIISVGGILKPQDAKKRLEFGARLVEVYTGWIFSGPAFPYQIEKSLSGI